MNAVTFPQPEVVAPALGAVFFVADASNNVSRMFWEGVAIDCEWLNSGNIYLTRAEAEQRAAWNRQEMARLVVPKWFRDLGPDVEWFDGREWVLYSAVLVAGSAPPDWSTVNPAHYRAKPKPAPDVVVNVNGKEYRWPATVKEGAPPSYRFFVLLRANKFEVDRYMWHCSGDTVHHTSEGALAQCAALNAALGVKQGEA